MKANLQTLSMTAMLMVVLLTGCEFTPPDKEPMSFTDPKEPTPQDVERDEGYALLYDLLKQESGVADIFNVKSASDPVKNVVTDIAEASKQAVTKLENIARQDGFLNFDDTGLPKVEEQTRKKIAFATAGSLLLSRGETFEKQLLLTQAEATKYAHYLAVTLAEAEDKSAVRKQIQAIAEQFKKLNERVIAMLWVKSES